MLSGFKETKHIKIHSSSSRLACLTLRRESIDNHRFESFRLHQAKRTIDGISWAFLSVVAPSPSTFRLRLLRLSSRSIYSKIRKSCVKIIKRKQWTNPNLTAPKISWVECKKKMFSSAHLFTTRNDDVPEPMSKCASKKWCWEKIIQLHTISIQTFIIEAQRSWWAWWGKKSFYFFFHVFES